MTAQQYRHFALYFVDGKLIEEDTEEYDSIDEMYVVVDQWLNHYRATGDIRMADLDPARNTSLVQMHSAYVVSDDDELGKYDTTVVLCSLPLIKSKHSVVETVNGKRTEYGPYSVSVNPMVNGCAIRLHPASKADVKFKELVNKHGITPAKNGRLTVGSRAIEGSRDYNGFCLSWTDASEKVFVDHVIITNGYKSALPKAGLKAI